ncbi:MAG: rhodanese-like domain-containing protein [Crocinitomicaceae bacterium]|jgi:phage shock protein E|nr:rhodanese-like domain-containing protein [Crocinitomicaceae bacterium]MDP4865278.1 rhodanese-like domain-containing protein [Crocinitomicaceae bacterium]MDP5011143.1 rhodanese-like domain-containing protein [Crocinitomicaceae bacterium]
MKTNRLFPIFILFLIFGTVSCASISQEETSAASYKNIQATEFSKLKSDPNTVIIDVRTPAETAAGVIEGASLFVDYTASNFGTEINKLDKTKNYIVYCRSGGRSVGASEQMIAAGFKNVYNLEGGISNWKGAVVAKP